MKKFVGEYGLSLTLSVSIMVLVGIVFGYYYEDNQVVLVNLLYYAKPNEMLITEWMNDFDFLLVPLWAVLAQKTKSIPFYAFWQLLQPLLWLSALSYFFLFELKVERVWLKILAVLIVIVLGIDSLVSQICFRNSIFLAGAALLFTRQRLIKGETQGVWPSVLFIFSLIPRSHPAAIILMLFMGHEILAGFGLKKVLKAHLPHMVACAVIIGSYQLYGMFATKNTGKILEAEYEYAWFEKGAYKPLRDMKTAKDSLKYWAVQQWYIADSSEFTLSFMDRVINRTSHFTSIWEASTYTNMLKETERLIRGYGYLLQLFVPLFFINYIISGASGFAKNSLTMLVYSGILLLLLIVLVTDIKERFFVPFTAVTILILLSDYLSNSTMVGNRNTPLIYALFLSSALMAVGFQLHRTSNIAKQFAESDNIAKQNLVALQQYTKKHPVLLTIDVPLPEVRNVFYRDEYGPYGNLAWIEAGYMVYYPYMEARIKNVAGFSALRFVDFLAAIEKNRNLRVITTASRMEVLSTYAAGIYSCSLSFVKDTVQPKWKLPQSSFYVTNELFRDCTSTKITQLRFLDIKKTKEYQIQR